MMLKIGATEFSSKNIVAVIPSGGGRWVEVRYLGGVKVRLMGTTVSEVLRIVTDAKAQAAADSDDG